MVQTFRTGERAKRVEFSNAILWDMEDEKFLPCLIFSDEATFHISGKANRHNVRIWGLENPQEISEHFRDSRKINVFCAVSFRSLWAFFQGKHNFRTNLS